MRKLIYAINISLDGCCDHRKGFADEELLDYYTQLLRDAGLLVYGRKTYEIMVPYWPDIAKNRTETKAEIEYADVFESIEKLVFSRTLESAEDKNSRIARGDLKDEILKLKQQQGNDIWVGGVDLPSQLTKLGLVDEFRIVVLPVFAGEGRRLFEDVVFPERKKLKLVESKVFDSGCVALRYVNQ